MRGSQFLKTKTKKIVAAIPRGSAWKVAALIIIIVAYLGVTNSVATQGYKLAEKQRYLNQLTNDKTELELRVAAMESLPRLEAEIASLSMTPLSNIDYLVPPVTAVAVR